MELPGAVDAFMVKMGCREPNQVFCLRRGQHESLEHRVNWMNCPAICWLCRYPGDHQEGHAGEICTDELTLFVQSDIVAQVCPMWADRRCASFWYRRDGRWEVIERVQHLFASNYDHQEPQRYPTESANQGQQFGYGGGGTPSGATFADGTSTGSQIPTSHRVLAWFHFRLRLGVPFNITSSLPGAVLIKHNGTRQRLSEGTSVQVSEVFGQSNFIYEFRRVGDTAFTTPQQMMQFMSSMGFSIHGNAEINIMAAHPHAVQPINGV
jgi:hypothetical protein